MFRRNHTRLATVFVVTLDGKFLPYDWTAAEVDVNAVPVWRQKRWPDGCFEAHYATLNRQCDVLRWASAVGGGPNQYLGLLIMAGALRVRVTGRRDSHAADPH
jgi:hypothetical protein